MQNGLHDFAESILGTCIYKLDIIRAMEVSPLSSFLEELQDFLKKEMEGIEDRSDLIDFRNLASSILQLLGILVTTKNKSAKWIGPLLREFYTKIDLNIDDRLILVAQSPGKIDHDTSEGFSVHVDILSHFKPVLPDKIMPSKKLDIFVVPSEAQFDLISLAVLGHEIGHVFWKERFKNFKAILIKYHKEYLKNEKKESKITLFKYQQEQDVFFSHIQETFCDEIGRNFFHVVFDLAMLKIMCLKSRDSKKVSLTHPPWRFRIAQSFQKLDVFSKINRNQELKSYLDKFLEDFKYCNRSVDYDKSSTVTNAVAELLETPAIRKLPLCKEQIDIEQVWNKVNSELNAFRPPVEVVDDGNPKTIKPIEIVIGVILYYYNSSYFEKYNEYYLTSGEAEETKRKKIKDILKTHLMYAISLYDFVQKAKELFPFHKEELKKTLWDLRTRRLGGKIAALTVVPSIYPKAQYGQNSVDLRLGSYFLILKPSKYTHISPYPGTQSIRDFYDEIYIPPGEEFILHPHQFILATTLEYINLPYDFYGLILGRSSWGRLGLNIATATTVQAGYRGSITLELRNLGETPLPLKVGARVAQLCLIKLPYESEGHEYFATKHNKYIGPIKAEPPKIKQDLDWKLLI